MSEITNQDRNAIKKIYRKVKPNTDRLLMEALPKMPPQHKDVHKVMAAQNAMRICFETIANECVPYDEYFLLEMATRMAAYAITTAPIESQTKLLELVQTYLPLMVENKLKQGAIIQAEWTDDAGVQSMAVPEKKDVN